MNRTCINEFIIVEMKKNIKLVLILVTAFFVVTSCNLWKIEYNFDEILIDDCMGERKKLYLPIGSTKSERTSYAEGFIETYNYSDKSVVSVLCGGNAELTFSKLFEKENYSRKEASLGRIIMYENVPKERKKEFDAAFDKMIE